MNYPSSIVQYFMIIAVAVKVYTAMDQTMLGILDTKESVGYYSISIRLIKVLLSFVTSLSIVMIPRISNSIKNNRTNEVKRYIGMSTNLVYLLASLNLIIIGLSNFLECKL